MATCMVYKKGSAYRLREGWVDHKIIDRHDMAKAELEGWVSNPLSLFTSEEPEPAVSVRLELEKQAKELGIGFNRRTTDGVLRERIAQAGEVDELDEEGDN